MEAKTLTEAQKAQMADELQRMTSEVKKHLKKMSKNDLIRTITAQLIDLHVLKQALAEQNSASIASDATGASNA